MSMATYQTFSDAAGKPESDTWCVVAGFLSTSARWQVFAERWKSLLVEHEVAYLQMSSLHARQGIFRDPKWEDGAYMASFLDAAGTIIRSCVEMWAVDIVSFADFAKAVTVNPGLAKYTNAYGLCGTAITLRMQMPHTWNHFPQRLSIQHFFEEGDRGTANIAKVFEYCGMQSLVVAPGKPHRTSERPYYVQFQAADWLAFENRKLISKYGHVTADKLHFRKSLKSLVHGLKGATKVWTYDDLLQFCAIKKARRQME